MPRRGQHGHRVRRHLHPRSDPARRARSSTADSPSPQECKRSTKPKPPPAAGAQAIDLAAYPANGPLALEPDQARQAAFDYLTATGHDGTVDVHDNQVDVTVHITQPMQILGIAGIGSLSVTGHGSAQPEHGVEAPEP